MSGEKIYYHGGSPGIKCGEFILPPTATGAKSLADYGAEGVCRRDRVYITTIYEAAVMFAAGIKDGMVYECVPSGILEPDPDCIDPGVSFQCEKAMVIRCIKPRQEEKDIALAALLPS